MDYRNVASFVYRVGTDLVLLVYVFGQTCRTALLAMWRTRSRTCKRQVENHALLFPFCFDEKIVPSNVASVAVNSYFLDQVEGLGNLLEMKRLFAEGKRLRDGTGGLPKSGHRNLPACAVQCICCRKPLMGDRLMSLKIEGLNMLIRLK